MTQKKKPVAPKKTPMKKDSIELAFEPDENQEEDEEVQILTELIDQAGDLLDDLREIGSLLDELADVKESNVPVPHPFPRDPEALVPAVKEWMKDLRAERKKRQAALRKKEGAAGKGRIH